MRWRLDGDSIVFALIVLAFGIFVALVLMNAKRRNEECAAWISQIGGRRLHGRDLECCAVLRDGSVKCRVPVAEQP